MVSRFKWPGDSNIPKRKEQLPKRYMLTYHGHEEDLTRKKEDEQAMVDDIPLNTVYDPADDTANETALEAEPDQATADEVVHWDIVAALLQIATTSV